MYRKGKVVEKDSKKMMHYYHKSADLGNIDACVALGEIYENGKDPSKDFPKALSYYTKAYDRGKKSLDSKIKRLQKKIK